MSNIQDIDELALFIIDSVSGKDSDENIETVKEILVEYLNLINN
jgi:hypothetical protein